MMMEKMLKIILLLTVMLGVYVVPYEAHAASIQLPQTGQTGCWDVNGNVIVCATAPLANGQDGKLKKGVALPVPRFTDNSNGTVTDKLTGLIWLKNANCMDTVGGIAKNSGALSGALVWKNALTWSNTLASGSCSLTDLSIAGSWRLPNINELESLVDWQNWNLVLPTGNPFSGVQANYYWSSTSYVLTNYANNAWTVDMVNGYLRYTNGKNSLNYVWPVRGGQSGDLGSLTTSPASKDYGPVVTNTTSAAQIFTLTNVGTGNLTLSAITLAGADSSMFTLAVGDGSAGTCGATPTIAAAGSCTVSTTFNPTSAGAKAASLRIETNDLPVANTYIPLSGTNALPTYSISTSVVGGNGTITCDSPVTSGGTSNCTVSGITAGYHLATFTDNTVDKLASVAANLYSIANVTADHAVAGTFAINPHTVSFNTNGGSAVSSQSVTDNTVATSPAAPTKMGYTFAGWYSDAALTSAFNFITAITSDTTLYAKWTATAITKADAIITWPTAGAITYGQTLATSTLSGGTSTPAGTFAFTTPTITPNAGTATQSVTFTPVDTANYNNSISTVSVTVNKATPVITWANPATINYGTTLSATQLNAAAGGVAGTFVYTPTAGTVLNAGAGHTLSVTFTPTDTVNYNSQSATMAITVILIDTTAPDTTLTAPATSPTLAVAITLGASDAVGVTGYLLKDTAVPPLPTDPGWTSSPPTSFTCHTWGNNILYAYAKDAAGNISAPKLTVILIGPTDGIIVPAAQKLEPTLEDALKSLNFAMKVLTPTPTEFAGANVSPLVNGIPRPPGGKTTINLGDTIVTLRRVIGL